MNNDKLRDFINSFTWTYAKTYAKVCPHEYIVEDIIQKKPVVKFLRDSFKHAIIQAVMIKGTKKAERW